MTYICAKIEIKDEDTSKNMSFFCIFDNFQHFASIEHNWIPKDIQIQPILPHISTKSRYCNHFPTQKWIK